MDAKSFWEALKQFTHKGTPLIEEGLREKVQFCASWILNPLSHSGSVDGYRGELSDAIITIRYLSVAVNNPAKSVEDTTEDDA